MNTVYRIVWNTVRRQWVVASELAAGRNKAGRRKRGANRGLAALPVCAALVWLVAALPSPVHAANYPVSTEAELRQAILDANADTDAASSIQLLNDIAITDPTALPAATKPLTIDTGVFVLSAPVAAGSDTGIGVSLGGGPLTLIGTITGGDAFTSAATGNGAAGGAGVTATAGTVGNQAAVTGGTGGGRSYVNNARAGAGGAGMSLTDNVLTNLASGVITGGTGGTMDVNGALNSGGNTWAGDGGAGVAMTDGMLDNRGVIVGGNGGAVLNAPAAGDNEWGGLAGTGAVLVGGTGHVNSGTITGGRGGAGTNQGTGAGSADGGSGLSLTDGTLANTATGTISGADGTPNALNNGRVSNGGAGALLANSTINNVGTISGGDSAGNGGGGSGLGGVGISGSDATVVNSGTISGGTSFNGSLANAIQFTGGVNVLELRAGWAITGNVVAFGAGDTLALGGSTNDSFDVSQIGAAAQYRGFGIYEKTGSSIWTLTGTTTATTPWTLLDGTLQISSDANLGDPAGGLTFDGGTLETTADIASNRTIALTGTGTLFTDAATTLALNGAISGAGALIKQGTGSLVLTSTNTYTGGTTISGGILQLGDGGTSGSIAGDIANNGALVFDRTDGALLLGGVISGTGTVDQIGSGTTTLAGIDTYTGATTITAGTLALGVNGAIAQSSGVEDNGTFDITSAGSTAITTLSGSGLVQLGGKTLELTDASDTFAGTLQGTGGLTLASGNETLTGASTYTGNTLVAGSELRLAGGGQMLGTAITTITGPGATLTVTGSGTLWSTGSLSLGSIAADPVTLNITDGARMEVTGAGQVNVGLHASATVNVSGPGSTWDTPTVFLNNNGSSNNIQGVVNVTDGGLATSDGLLMGSPFGGGNLDAVALVSGTGSAWTIQNNLSIFKGAMSILDGGSVTAASGSMSGTAAHPAGLLVSGTGSRLESAGTFRIGSSSSTATLAEGGRLAAGGAVTLMGTLNIGGAVGEAATDAGVLDAGTLVFGGSTGTLNFNHTDTDYLFGALISGTGTVNQTGPGSTIFTADNTYIGATTISDGTLQLGNGGTTGSIVGDVIANGTLAFDRSNALAYAGAISGSGAVHQLGAGRTDLTGDSSSFTGATSVTRGTLAVNGSLGDTSSTMTVSNGGILAGAGTIGGSVTTTDGHLAPGNSPGTLTINGNLSLGAASNLDYELGAAGVAGGAFNDLTEVGGNLTLDGTLNVTQSAGGTYGVGIYRLIDYSGTLTDHGVALGSMPAGTDNYVQTAIAHQVNLVNSQGLQLNYWDGDAGPKNNSVVDGGNGTWLAAPGNDNWTEASGAINAPYQNAAFAIFAGKAGTVTVDDSAGAISVSGMQFATDGYMVQGDAINLTAGTNAIRIGDGTMAGAGVTATIDSELTGPGKLDKVDLGTLVLTGDNAYTGGTTISDGTLQLGDGGTSGSVAGAIIDNGTLAIDRSDAVTFGAISGTGGIDQIGAGTTTLTGSNTYAGATRVVAGTLAAGAAHAFSATSATTIAARAMLDLNGLNQDVASLDNSGMVSFSSTTPGITLTVHGNYVGHDGVLRMGTTLDAGASAADRLVVDGGMASGHTTIQLSNLGGLGGLTTGDGIELVSAINGATTTAQTTADAFALAGGHVDAGAFEYRLYAGDADDAGENWYLRSTTDTPPPVDGGGTTPPPGGDESTVVAYRPEVALHASVSGLLRQADLGMLGNLQRRVGDDNAGAGDDGRRAWARVINQDLQTAHVGTVSPSTDGTLQGVQAGVDLVHRDSRGGAYRIGVYAGHLRGSSRAYGFASGVEHNRVGDLDVRSSYAGAYGTYMANAGWYADAVLQQGWHKGRAHVLSGQRDDAGGTSTQASLELGKDVALSSHWLVEPQVQFIVGHLSVDTQRISGATITQRAATTLTSRLGVRFKGSYATARGQLQPYVRMNIWHGSAGTDRMVFAGPGGSAEIRSGRGYSSGEVAAGLTWMINPRFSLYSEVGRLYSLDDLIGAQARSTLSASAGLRVNW